MPLMLVTGHQNVARLQALLEKQVKDGSTHIGKKRIDVSTGGTADGLDVYLMEETGIWASFNPGEHQKFWNAFGTEKVTRRRLHISVEANPYHGEGIDRRTGGAFTLDEAGTPLLVHKGRINHMPQETVLGAFEGDAEVMFEPGGANPVRVLVIGELGSPAFPRQLANFVREIERIKTYRKRQEELQDLTLGMPHYSPEYMGDVILRRRGGVTRYRRVHGLIVHALKEALSGYADVGNDQRDLVALQRGRRRPLLFETKSGCASTEVHQAVGQLQVYSEMMPRQPRKKVAVFPVEFPPEMERILNRLGIEVLRYTEDNGAITFHDLDAVLR